jgi:hypothetical protein
MPKLLTGSAKQSANDPSISSDKNVIGHKKLLVLVCTLGAVCPASFASDWGYDEGQGQKPQPTNKKSSGLANDGKQNDSAPQAVELKATPAKPLNAVKEAGKPESAMKGASKKTATKVSKTSAKPAADLSGASADRRVNAIEDWLELFGLVVKEKLSQEQKDRFRQLLEHKLKTAQSADVYEVLDYWPDVQQHIGANAEEKEAFASLFRSLLRFESRSKSICPDDAAILSELLGPERIAVPGDPALTEDSVDAYGDMACFMYEQAHAGKTVDAIDNRTVFAAVICGKFEHAPTVADKRAMANFALTWAKFKVTYLLAAGEQRQILLQQVQSGKPPNNKEEKASLVSAIFNHGPWHSVTQ